MGRRPRYDMIYRDIASQVKEHVLQPGARLPSEATMAAQYGVSRMTVRQAMSQLEAEGYVDRRHGTGTFVSGNVQSSVRRMNRLGSFQDDIGIAKSKLTTRVHVQEVLAVPPDIQSELRLKPEQQVIHLVRVRSLDGKPVALQESFIPYAVAPGIARAPLAKDSLYRSLADSGVVLGYAEQRVSASSATAEQAELLSIDEGSPLVAIERLTYSVDSTPIECAHSWTRPEFPLFIRLEA